MSYVRKLLALLLLVAMTLTLSAQTKYSRIKIVPPQDKQQRAGLLGLLEIDHFDMQDGAIIAEIDQQKIALLQRTSFQYEIVVPDVAAHINEMNQRYFAAS